MSIVSFGTTTWRGNLRQFFKRKEILSSKFQYEAIVKKGKGKGLGVCLLAFTEWLIYHGCEVIFNKGKAFLRHIATG